MREGQTDLGRPIRVVVFCGGPVLDRAVVRFASRLMAHSEIEFLGGFCQSSGQTLGAVIRDRLKRRGPLGAAVLLFEALQTVGRALIHPRREAELRRQRARVSQRIEFVPDIHSEATIDRLRAVDPDLGLIYGSPMLKPALFQIPRLGTLGIHHGKAPEYRGKKTTFWAMYNGEETAGVTIQRVNAGIDTGEIVQRGEVRTGHKSLARVVCELEELGFKLYVQAIVDVKRGTARFLPPDGEKGKLYRDPKGGDMARFWWRQVKRRIRPGLASVIEPLKKEPSVCLLTETFYPVVGGGEAQTRVLAEDLVAQGFSATVVTRRSSTALEKVGRVDGITVCRTPPVGEGRLVRWGMVFACLPTLWSRRQQYDLIYVSGFKALGIPAVIVSKLLRKGCVLKADSNGEMSGAFFVAGLRKVGLTPASPVVRFCLKARNKLLREADFFVAISSDIANELRHNGVQPDKILRITNSVDTSRFLPADPAEKAALRRRLDLPENHVILAYVGRLVSYKGLPLLVRVWGEVQRVHKHATLLLVGSGGLDMHNCEAELREYVRANGLHERTRFTGDVQNVPDYLRASDIFAFPTEKDAFPVALVEAMACGLPVIATPTGGIKDIITHRENGLIVEPGDHQQLYKAICTLIADHSLANILGAAALKTAQDRYSREIIARKYVDLFRGISNNGVSAVVGRS